MTFPGQYRDRLAEAIASIDVEKVGQAIRLLAETRDQGRRIFVCGNGGSACTASHFAMEMVKGASYGKDSRFRILALNESAPTITAYSNDVSYECIFAEQLKNFAEPGDVLVAISSSGNSPNVLRAVEYANSAGCHTIGLTGYEGGKLGPLVELEIRTADHHTGRVEDTHMVVLHMICYYFMQEERSHSTA